MAQTHKSMIWQSGFDRGQCVASWMDIPNIGEVLPKHIDWLGIGTIEHEHEQADAFFMLCHDAEENGRDFSPFEFTARELNELQESKDYDVWEVFEAGILAEWNERKPTREDRMSDRIDKIMAALPHGSGINCDWTADTLKNGKVRFYNSYHVMSEHGFYIGWADCSVTLDPRQDGETMAAGFRLMFHGQAAQYLNRYYGLRDYLEDTIAYCLGEVDN